MERMNRWQPLMFAAARRGRSSTAASWLVRPDRLAGDALDDLVASVLADDRAPGVVHLLLRSGPWTVVGGVSRTCVLTDTLRPAADRCFIGWVTRQDHPAVPRLDRLEDRWVAWAGEVYDSWIPVAADHGPNRPPLGAPPWTADDEVARPVPVGGTARTPHAPAVPRVEVSGPPRHARWETHAGRDGDLALLTSPQAPPVLAGAVPERVRQARAYEEPYLDGDYREAGFSRR